MTKPISEITCHRLATTLFNFRSKNVFIIFNIFCSISSCGMVPSNLTFRISMHIYIAQMFGFIYPLMPAIRTRIIFQVPLMFFHGRIECLSVPDLGNYLLISILHFLFVYHALDFIDDSLGILFLLVRMCKDS